MESCLLHPLVECADEQHGDEAEEQLAFHLRIVVHAVIMQSGDD